MRWRLPATMALAALLAGALSAHGFDLQGHRGARGLAPENTLPAFTIALAIGVTTLELDLAMTRDGVLVVSHDRMLNPDYTRGPDGAFLDAPGPAIRALTLAELRRYDVGRLKPGTDYAKTFPDQKPVDGTRIPTLAEVFALVRQSGADHVRFNIETKLTPASGEETADPDTFAAAVAQAARGAGLTARVAVQSFDWRTLMALRRIAPEIPRVCLTLQGGGNDTVRRSTPGPSPWTAGLDVDDHDGSTPRLVATAGCAVWSPNFRSVTPEWLAEAKRIGLSVIPWTVNERADMERLIDLGVDGLISDYPDRLRAVLSGKGIAVPPAVVTRAQ
jgi:glycerophosphoryl diester phosphodiesterase